MSVYIVVNLLFFLVIKHCIADLAIQKLFPSNKLQYLNKDAHKHYLHHALGSFIVGVFFNLYFAALIFVLDYLIHWHVDFVKTHVRKYYDLQERDYMFWVLQSVDQALHFSTYYLFVVLFLQFYS